MLSIGFDYDEDFCNIYNKFNTTFTGKELLKIFGISRDKLDIATMSKNYFLDDNFSIDPNANASGERSPNSYTSEVVKGLQKLNGTYLIFKELSNMYDLETAKKCIESLVLGSHYFHDLTAAGCTVPYCFAFPTYNVMVDGRKYGQLQSKPPKRADSFISVTMETLFELGSSFMGALAPGDFLLNISYFYNKEKVDLKKDRYRIINDFQRITHQLNLKFRTGAQSLFSNISIFDRVIFKKIFEDLYFPDGSRALDLMEYFMELQEMFVQFMSEKDPTSGLPYRFPVTTLNIYADENNKIVDEKFFDVICKYNIEGIFNIFISRGNIKLSSCCRLSNDINMLREFSSDTFGNGSLSIGSARVVTINFARIGKQAKKNKGKYFEILTDRMETTRKLLKAHRYLLSKKIEQGFLKFFSIGWINMNMFFSTFGMNGLYESLEFMGLDLRKEDGLNFAKEIFEFVEMKLSEFSEEDHIPYNFEQIPAEGSASTLAKMDKIYFNDEDYPYKIYANQFIPLWMSDVDVIERAKIDGILGNKMSGGFISHLGISGQASPEQIKSLIMLAVESGLEHFALNPLFLQCENGHTTMGKPTDTICPQCQAPIKEHYTRVVGYFTPVSNWDKTRREEDFPNRVFNYLEEHREEDL